MSQQTSAVDDSVTNAGYALSMRGARRMPEAGSHQVVVRAGLLSVGFGCLFVGLKFAAWVMTGATVLLADAAESVVNVIAAGIATYSVAVAARPADQDHPYGHGKAEALSAAVEGMLIGGAAAVIVVEAIRQIIAGPQLERLGAGMVVAGVAGAGNLMLGIYLVRVGRRERSEAIRADGVHVITDVLMTAGGIVALVAIQLTGLAILDPLVALLVAAYVVGAGWRVARRAMVGLLDEADLDWVSRIAARFEALRRPEWIDIHALRARRSGPDYQVDLHLTVPRFLSIGSAHEAGDALERVLHEFGVDTGAAVIHLDPCQPRNCPSCVVEDCPVRSRPLAERPPFDLASVTRPGPP